MLSLVALAAPALTPAAAQSGSRQLDAKALKAVLASGGGLFEGALTTLKLSPGGGFSFVMSTAPGAPPSMQIGGTWSRDPMTSRVCLLAPPAEPVLYGRRSKAAPSGQTIDYPAYLSHLAVWGLGASFDGPARAEASRQGNDAPLAGVDSKAIKPGTPFLFVAIPRQRTQQKIEYATYQFAIDKSMGAYQLVYPLSANPGKPTCMALTDNLFEFKRARALTSAERSALDAEARAWVAPATFVSPDGGAVFNRIAPMANSRFLLPETRLSTITKELDPERLYRAAVSVLIQPKSGFSQSPVQVKASNRGKGIAFGSARGMTSDMDFDVELHIGGKGSVEVIVRSLADPLTVNLESEIGKNLLEEIKTAAILSGPIESGATKPGARP